jgi:transposase
VRSGVHRTPEAVDDDDVATVRACGPGSHGAGREGGVPEGMPGDRIRDALGELFDDVQFAGLFATRGRPAVSPARLALVSVLQFAEGLSDRQAADAVRARIDWKYALGLELADTGFDASVLSEFRARLLTDGQAERLLQRMLERLRAQGLLVRGGRQRTDATCVVAVVRELNRLELVTETMRAALEALAAAAPEWLVALAPADWYQRYGQRASDYRLPQHQTARAALAVTVGTDGFALLEAVYAADTTGWLRQVPAVQTLRAVWLQQYYRDRQGLRWRGKGEQPPAALAIDSPYDTDARYGVKRGVGWRGYKAHLHRDLRARPAPPAPTGPAAPARRSTPGISPSGPAPRTRPNASSAPSRPPRPGATAMPTGPGSRAPSRRPVAAATCTRPATAACPRPTCSTC